MLPGQFAILTVVISFIAGLGYLVSALKGKTKPNRVSWGLLSFIMTIIFFAQLDAGVGWPIVSVSIALFNSLSIFAVSFINPDAYWKSERKDYVFAAISVVGVILWQTTDNPELAIAFNMVADFMAWSPTMIKAYKSPATEKLSTWAAWGVAHIFALLVINDWTFANWSFSLYLAVGNLVVAGLIVLGMRRDRAALAA